MQTKPNEQLEPRDDDLFPRRQIPVVKPTAGQARRQKPNRYEPCQRDMLCGGCQPEAAYGVQIIALQIGTRLAA